MLRRIFSARRSETSGATGGAYTVGERDSVRQLVDVPKSSTGAPLPVLIANDDILAVAYFCDGAGSGSRGAWPEAVSRESESRLVGIVRFYDNRAHYFGPPNDEAFSGHPLASRGLAPYGSFEVAHSSWIRALEQMNSVHPNHSPELFSRGRHFVLAFHDSVFECIAGYYESEVRRGSLKSVVGDIWAEA